jgi:hypothetical protein
MVGKCPKCDALVTRLDIHPLDAGTYGDAWKAVTYNCPMCSTVLGCQIDPIAVRTDIINSIKKLLGRA